MNALEEVDHDEKIVPADPDKVIENPSKEDTDIVMKSRVRKLLPASMKVSTEFSLALETAVAQIIADSVLACRAAQRNTLKAKDVETAMKKDLNRFIGLVLGTIESERR